MGRLEGKVAVITGSSVGIGEATARLFAREGAKVVVVAHSNVTAGQSVVDSILASGGEAILVQADVSKEADCKRLIEAAVDMWGKLDILVNNAGICRLIPTTELTEDEFDETFATNVKSVVFCCKYAIPHMIANGGGAIVTTSSRAAFIPTNISPLYCASKAADLAFTHAVAHEYAKFGIRANTILPSNIWTPMARKFCADSPDPKAAAEWFDKSQPIGRAGTPEETAQAILFLASDEASFITSTPLLVDGGFFFS